MENKIANPAPLGLLGFGMTTVLLNLANAGVMPLSMTIAAMGFALGGLAQIIAGVLEFKNGNTFGGTAFTAYGLFWWSLVFIWANPGKFLPGADAKSLGFYLLLWCVFTLFMAIGTLKHNHANQMVFFSLALLFLLLALHAFTGVAMVGTIAGIVGIICGLSAIYNALGQVVNGEYGHSVMPLGDKK
ncbi:MAG: acetate uptake transporter [Coriobacteriia bacterium]|nr:acetate uptake transporter [Coriobacteriia bacterium]